MKTPITTTSLFCCILPLSASAAGLVPIYTNNFDSEMNGAVPTSFTSVGNPANTTIEITTDESSSAPNSMRIIDNSGTGTGLSTPSVTQTFSQNYGEYTYSFDYLMGTGGDIQRTEFYAFNGAGGKQLDFRFDGGRLQLKLNGSSNVAQGPLFTSLSGWNVGGWNTFSYEVSDSAGTVKAYVNGVEALTYDDVGNTLNWSAGRFTIFNGYSSTNNNVAYYDNIVFAVPEPGTALLSLVGVGLLIRRRR